MSHVRTLCDYAPRKRCGHSSSTSSGRTFRRAPTSRPRSPCRSLRLQRDADGEKRRHFRARPLEFPPAFVKNPKDFPLVINARSETVFEKASFRNAMKRRRCIFIADAFYEWRRFPKPAKGKARPRSLSSSNGATARPWRWPAVGNWTGPDGEEVDGACILTTDANGLMASIHDRMPVILEPEDFDAWLECDETDVKPAARLMKPARDDVLEAWPISTDVNKVANDNPAIQTPVGKVECVEGLTGLQGGAADAAEDAAPRQGPVRLGSPRNGRSRPANQLL